MKVYPIAEGELDALRMWAWMALLIVGIPFLVIEVFQFVSRVKRETEFAEASAVSDDR